MASRQHLESTIQECETLISSKHIGSGFHSISDEQIAEAERTKVEANLRLEATGIHQTLLDLVETWNDSYCHSTDDGGAVEDAILQHARAMLGRSSLSLDECNAMLDKIVDALGARYA
jgi:hypothetical protein